MSKKLKKLNKHLCDLNKGEIAQYEKELKHTILQPKYFCKKCIRLSSDKTMKHYIRTRDHELQRMAKDAKKRVLEKIKEQKTLKQTGESATILDKKTMELESRIKAMEKDLTSTHTIEG